MASGEVHTARGSLSSRFNLRVGHSVMLESTHPEVRACVQTPALYPLLVFAPGLLALSLNLKTATNEMPQAVYAASARHKANAQGVPSKP